MKMITKFLYLAMAFMALSAFVAGQNATDNIDNLYKPDGMDSKMAPAVELAPSNMPVQGEPGEFDPGFIPFSAQAELYGNDGTEDTKIWVLPSTGGTSAVTRAPGNTWLFQRTMYLISPTNMAESGFPTGASISSIGFLISTAGVGTLTGTFKVYLLNTTDATYSLGSSWNVTGFTQVNNNPSFTVPIGPSGSVYDEVFSGGAPFIYTGGGVYVAWEFESAGPVGTTAVIHSCNTALASSLYGSRSNTSMPTTLAVSSFRPATRFGTTDFDDIVSVTNIYSMEKVPTPFGTPTPVGVRVENVTGAPVTFDLTLEVRETVFSVLRHTETQTNVNLPANSSAVISFATWNPILLENVNVRAFTSTIPGETWTVNNTLTIPVNVNDDQFSYNYSNTPAGAVGFPLNTNAILANKYTMNGVGTIASADIVIANNAASTGNTVYAVLLNNLGTIVAQTANYIIQASDLGNVKTFNFPTPVTFNNEIFYVGLAQTYLSGAVAYFPMGILNEIPPRGNTFYTFAITGGTPSASTGSWKFMNDAIVGAGITNDVAVLSIDMNEVLNPGIIAPQATVINNGILTQTFDVEMIISPGGYSSVKTVTSLPPGGTQQVIFDPWTSAIGDYTLTVCTQLAGDLVPANDCKSQSAKVLDLNKVVYGYNAFPGSGSDPEGPMTFNMATPGNLTSIADQSALDFIAGGTWANGLWYGTVYNTIAPFNFVTIDPGTGARTIVGDMGVNINGLSYNPANGMMYGVGYDGASNSQLYTIDMTTGLATLVGDCGPGLLINLAINNAGQAYSINLGTDFLGSINLMTGAFTPIGYVGYDLNFAQDMEFDRDADLLYAAAYFSGSGFIGLVDVATGNMMKAGHFEGNAEITGFAIPYSSGYNVTGTLLYNGDPAKPLDNVTIDLIQGVTVIGTAVTAASGSFVFANIPNGNYYYEANTIKMRGGTNLADINLIVDHLLGSVLTGLPYNSSDVNIDGLVTLADLNAIIDELLGISAGWAAPDWLFDNPSINVSGSDVTQDFNALCSGDPDGSYLPPAGK
jgi:hypothetical protein